MSVGERQRVAIALRLANDPILLLADEPTGSLDSKTGDEVIELFRSLHVGSGMTIVLVTHDAQVTARADRLIHIRDGRIESDGVSKRAGTTLPHAQVSARVPI